MKKAKTGGLGRELGALVLRRNVLAKERPETPLSDAHLPAPPTPRAGTPAAPPGAAIRPTRFQPPPSFDDAVLE